jgi:LysM repeat protein
MPKINRSLTSGLVILLTMAMGFFNYTVKPGDTLSDIADDHDVTVTALVKANSIKNPNLIRPGQVLTIPGDSSDSGTSGSRSESAHVVVRGDSLGKLAVKYGVTVTQLMALNGITDPDKIYLGAKIIVDGSTRVLAVNLASDTTDLTHLVTKGESLAKIASKYDTTISTLLAHNDIEDPNLIVIGQEITVPNATGWRCPVPTGNFINDWGFPRSDGRGHAGTDIFAVRGALVVAPVSGDAEQKTGTLGGIQVRFWGDDGHVYWLTHLEGFGKGGQVNAGDVIGYVGDSGNAKGSSPHVHFEIHPDNGAATNPYPTLSGACR